MVNMLTRRVRVTQAPRPGLLGGVLPAAPRGQVGMLHDYIEQGGGGDHPALPQWKHNGRPAGNGRNRSTNNAKWGAGYYDRTGTARSNLFHNRPDETRYFYTDDDAKGAAIDGSKTYAITFPAGQEPPVNGFWSLTLCAGTKSPGADKESDWLPAPEGPFSLYIRAYWGKEAILDISWTPPRIEVMP